MTNSHAFIDPLTREVERLVSAPTEDIPEGLVLAGLAEPQQYWPEGIGKLFLDENGVLYFVDTRTLEEIKIAHLNVLREKREQVIAGGFVWDGSTFDSDALSQQRLLGAVTAATTGGVTSVTWRLANNTWRTLSNTDIGSVYGALTLHVGAAFNHFQALELAIQAATNKTEVLAVSW